MSTKIVEHLRKSMKPINGLGSYYHPPCFADDLPQPSETPEAVVGGVTTEAVREKSMEVHGNPWISMEIHGGPWKSMDIHGYPWISMEIHGNPWISMDFYGFPWISMDFHRFPWISTIFYDFIFKETI